MIRKLNTFGKPVLYKRTMPIQPKAAAGLTGAMDDSQSLWSQEIEDLAKDLVDTAESMADNCLGLAATQIWHKDTPCPRMFVMRWPIDPNNEEAKKQHPRGWTFQVILNPVVKTTGKTIKWEEGCLSLPGKSFHKKRGKNCIMTFQFMNSVKPISMKFFGKDNIIPYIIQHEVDHLDGKLINNSFKHKE